MTDPTSKQPRLDLIVCPNCDAVYALQKPKHGERAICERCDTVLIAPRRKAGMQIIALSLAVMVLIVSAALFPFLTVQVGPAHHSVSIIDTALAFRDGPLIFLSLTTVSLIILIPLLRVLLSLYVLVPIVADKPPARHAARAFRIVEALRPWSMAEIFAIGCAVALIKIGALADVTFGPAFWMFAVLVVLVVVQENYICRWSVWNALNKPAKS
ncbi:MAG: paraquat-inducible protein A [Roseobacter sp.]|jgi:paraquat-inducible protein A|nr:paraquat-inducible protein A [Roseobacter sp.]